MTAFKLPATHPAFKSSYEQQPKMSRYKHFKEAIFSASSASMGDELVYASEQWLHEVTGMSLEECAQFFEWQGSHVFCANDLRNFSKTIK